MACKPLPEPILTYHPKEHISMKFHFKFWCFHSQKCIWKCPKMAAILSQTSVTLTLALTILLLFLSLYLSILDGRLNEVIVLLKLVADLFAFALRPMLQEWILLFLLLRHFVTVVVIAKGTTGTTMTTFFMTFMFFMLLFMFVFTFVFLDRRICGRFLEAYNTFFLNVLWNWSNLFWGQITSA